MSLFITKPYYEQVNEVNSLLFQIKKANMEILKDQIENPEIDNFTNDTKGKVNKLINELESLLTKSIVQLNIISSITSFDSKTKKYYGLKTQAYQDYVALVKSWDDYDKSIKAHAKWVKDLQDVLNKPKGKKEKLADYNDRELIFRAKNPEPQILPQPLQPLIPMPAVELENIGLTTIPQIMDIRKAYAFFESIKIRFNIIYNELLQFERFLNKENTKGLTTILKELKDSLNTFIDLYYYKNSDGELEQKDITPNKNYGKDFQATLMKNADFIFDLFNTYYYNFNDLVDNAQYNPDI
jgi:hypothetical protein